MPISNIVDHRKNKYDVNCTVIFEESWHDNSVKDATQFDDSIEEILYLSIRETTVQKAIKYINKNFKVDVTMFLYDTGFDHHHRYLTIDDNLELVTLLH